MTMTLFLHALSEMHLEEMDHVCKVNNIRYSSLCSLHSFEVFKHSGKLLLGFR